MVSSLYEFKEKFKHELRLKLGEPYVGSL